MTQLDGIARLKLRRGAEWTLSIALILFALYLRLFVFLKISLGALLVYLCFGCGVMLAEDARRVGAKIKARQLSE